MSPILVGILGIVLLLVGMALGVWIGFAIGIAGIVGLIIIQGVNGALMVAEASPFTFITNYSFTVMPMFILMGNVIAETGIGADLYYAAHKWLGRIAGGLAIATVFASAMFAAIVGSSTAGVIVFSKVAYPEMKRYAYNEALTAGAIVASATMSIMIPPSISFIIYGVLTENSVGKLFIAGIIPGAIQAICYVALIYIRCRINPNLGPRGPSTTLKEKFSALKNVWMMLALFLLVMGCIYTGICTPTEAGAIGAFGAIVISFAARRLNLKRLSNALLESGIMLGMMLFLMMATAIFMKFMAVSSIPMWLANSVTGLGISRFWVLIIIILIYLICGTALPAMLIIILTIPIIYPLILALGYDPIWFGVLMTMMTEIGDISPPEGMICFLYSGMTNTPIITVFRGLLPFVALDFLRVAILIAFPQTALFLPSMMLR